MTTLAITGASGYLGGIVALAADRDPQFKVRPLVRSTTPWLPGDAVHVPELCQAPEQAFEGADAVVHLAGANEVATRSDPDAALCSAITTSRAVARACERARVRRVVYISTVHVYGEALQNELTVTEETAPRPRSDYALARLASEHILASELERVELVIFRLTNAVGPPGDPAVDRWTLVANDLCVQAVTGGPLRLKTLGLQTRDFVPADDVARIVLAACRPGSLSADTYNLASGRVMAIRELASLIAGEAEGLGLGPMEVLAPPGDGSVNQSAEVSTQRLESAGFRPSTDVEGAIRSTLRFCALHSARFGSHLHLGP